MKLRLLAVYSVVRIYQYYIMHIYTVPADLKHGKRMVSLGLSLTVIFLCVYVHMYVRIYAYHRPF